MIRLLFLLSFITLPAQADTATRDALLAGEKAFYLALPFDDFIAPEGATQGAPLEGRLRLDMTALGGGFQLVRDPGDIAANPDHAVRSLPVIDLDLVQEGDDIIPKNQGIIETAHPYFDLIFTPGKSWAEARGQRFISLPFALMEKNANCIHNGALLLAIDALGKASVALAQIGSETCAYFQFNFWAAYEADWSAGPVEGASAIRETHRAVQAARLPVRTMAELPQGLEEKNFSQDDVIPPAFMSAYGLVLEGLHYRSGCATRLGPYPHCDSLVLPSYSLAKSLAGGLGLMRLEGLYGDAFTAKVSDLIPACADWGDVTLGDLLNMSTGRYASRVPHADEAAEPYMRFFTTLAGQEKTAFACTHFGSKTKPGKRWVYHTSDTYLLGVAMNAFLAKRAAEGADYYRDQLVPIWQSMPLSPLMAIMRQTGGPDAAPFTGYGMVLTTDDIARVSSALAGGDTRLISQFAPHPLAAALQREPRDRGLEAGAKSLRYKNGFWAWNARESLGCKADTWLPFFSGYGGITVVLLPGGNVYYYFSDSGLHVFADAVKALSAITPICGETS
ncbi:hypothetical protein [Kordiimonas sp.]|uniref:hypothetical protein n=1 Tax=Kordiimonas sp. TaxID=1970157 RepID=UPI003A8D2664